MKIWIATHRNCVAYERVFFSLLRDALASVSSQRRVGERFGTLLTLSNLPWLDQPFRFDALLFEREIFRAWDELCGVPMNELHLQRSTRRGLLERPIGFERPGGGTSQVCVLPQSDETIGELFQQPVGDMVGITAAAIGRSSMRAATNRALVAGSAMHQMWRVVRGGHASLPSEAFGVELA